jgi:two-component system, OmpR family, sensor histidine kinase KdpD
MQRCRYLAQRHGYLAAVFLVAVGTAVFSLGRADFVKGQWALLYVLIVGLVAGLSGVRPALLAAVLSFFAWVFFILPPYGTFVMPDPRDWLFLLVFLVVAISSGFQTGRLREREAAAVAREQETALLNRFGARLVSNVEVSEVAGPLIREVSEITGAECVALLLPTASGALQEVAASPGAVCHRTAEVRQLAAWANREGRAVGLPVSQSPSGESAHWPVSVGHAEAGVTGTRHDFALPLQTSTRQSGVLYVGARTDGRPYTDAEARPVVALANQTSMFLERKHLQSMAVQADIVREADRMKFTLVSAVSHELKTPLASLTATISGLLLEGDAAWMEGRAQRELAAVIQDLARLGSSINALVDLSRLEASEWRPYIESCEFEEVLGSALLRLPPTQRGRVSASLPDDLPTIRVDFDQWVRVLEHLLGNALIYSGPDGPVRVGAEGAEREVRMWVEDEGPGLPPEERQRVFDKFYRGKSAATIPGTGIGLAITSEIVRFHGGRVWIEDVVPHGARFMVALPREEGDGRT